MSIERTKRTHHHHTSTSTIMKEITSAAENLVAVATAQLEVVKDQILRITSAPAIENCNSICAFPETGLTIGVAENGAPIIVNSYTPTQFTPATAREICEKVSNGRGEHPIIVSPLNYYTAEQQRLVELIELFTTK